MIRRRRIFVGGLIALASWVPQAASAAPQSKPTAQHCVLQVTGQAIDGELLTDPLECDSGSAPAVMMTASSSVIARHYTGYNYTGSELDILGSDCTGGWLNMPAGWVNVIASTQSSCIVDHYDYFYLGGTHVATYPPGANLYSFYARTNSASYS